MSVSLLLMAGGGVPLRGIVYTGIFMALVAVWAWRFPGSVEEHQRRVDAGKRVAWFK
jgi:hypothetical protein